jgi:nitrogen-specific signal transduction histidine kinase
LSKDISSITRNADNKKEEREENKKLQQAEQERGGRELKTELLYGAENAVRRGVYFMSNVKKGMDIYFDHRAPSIVVEVQEYRNGYLDIRRSGGKIRAFTEITKDNVYYCKELMKLVDELRHLDGVKGGIAVSESEYMATTVLEEAKPLTQVMYSNVKEVVEQAQYIFDTFWNKAIPAEDRIREIEEGIKPDFIETIRDPNQVQKITFDIVRSAEEEILAIFSTANAFDRQKRAGTIELLKEAADLRGIKVRILTPFDERIKKSEEEEEKEDDNGSNDDSDSNINNNKRVCNPTNNGKIKIQFIEPVLQTKVSILVVDRKFSLSVEVKDDSKDTSYKAMGLTSYSNSKSTVLSYASIFEALWIQTKLYEQLKEHERMEKEFIDIAAHELRTPLQPIISYNALALKNLIDKDEAMRVIDKQARRLQKLATDLLAASRIESGNLTYKMEKTKINDIILDVINSAAITTAKANNHHHHLDKKELSIKTELDSANSNIEIDADKDRITQALFNIIDNAIKFTSKGIIKIENHVYLDKNKIEIRVSDTGSGIPKDILPRLFSKFVTRSVGKGSQHGTGLGLFITKAIVTAHNGQITAFNNDDRGGATFTIVLPINRKGKS